jgi:hypothetical protein
MQFAFNRCTVAIPQPLSGRAAPRQFRHRSHLVGPKPGKARRDLLLAADSKSHAARAWLGSPPLERSSVAEVRRRARDRGPKEPRSSACGRAWAACAIAVAAMATLVGTGLAQQGGVGVSTQHVDFGEIGLGSLSPEVSVRQLATGTPTLTDSSTSTDSSGASPWRVSGIAIAVGIVSVGGAFVMARTRTRQLTGIGWRRRRNEARGRHTAEEDEPGWSGDRAERAGGS